MSAVHRRRPALLVALGLGAMTLLPGTGVGASSATISDGLSDAPPSAPEVQEVRIDSNEAGEIQLQFKLQEALAEAVGDGGEFGSLSVYFDTDNNPATTYPDSRMVAGSETLVTIYNNGAGIYGAIDSIALLDSFTSDPTTAVASWKVSNLRHLGLTPGQTVGVRAFSVGPESGGNERDFVPSLDAGGNPTWFPYQVSAAAPPPAPPAPVAPVVVPPTVVPVSAPRTPARPIAGTPLKLPYAAGKVTAQFGWRRASDRVRWSLALSARVKGTVRKKTVTGSLQSAAAGLTRRVPFVVPVGTPVQARLTVRSGSQNFTRTVFVTRRR